MEVYTVLQVGYCNSSSRNPRNVRGTIQHIQRFGLKPYQVVVRSIQVFARRIKVSDLAGTVPRVFRGFREELFNYGFVAASVTSDALDKPPALVLSPVSARRRYPAWPR